MRLGKKEGRVVEIIRLIASMACQQEERKKELCWNLTKSAADIYTWF
jgi:hypothetical protein